MTAPATASPRLSLIVPAHDEETLLPRLLDSVAAARAALPDGDDAVEVVVVDDASSDRTAGVAAARGARVVRIEARSIAVARNAGAAAARAPALAFTDADGAIHPRTFLAVERALADPRTIAGSTGVTMERCSAGIALTFAVALPWIWTFRFDTGVVFVGRDDFAAVGGYDESRRFGEDLDLMIALRRRGRSTGRRLVRLRGVKTVTSARKFDRHGDWHYFTRMPPLAWRWLLGRRDRDEFAERYWYGPREDDRRPGAE